MNARRAIGSAALWLGACAAPADGTEIAAVTNGAPDAQHPAVVALVDAAGMVGCTATAIGPHVAITAAHCVDGRDPRALRIVFGDDASGGLATAVGDARVHPAYDAPTFAHDLAMLAFHDEAPATAPLAPGPFAVGDPITVVGFGATAGGATDTGTKRSGTATLSAVTADELTAAPAPSQPCRGDSGGPAIVAAGIAGVVSHGDAACSDHATYARIDAAFVADYTASVAPGTAATGQPCFYDAHCASGPCVQAADDPLLFYCSQRCARDADCPAAMRCTAHACVYPQPTPGALGGACEDDAPCTSHLCRDEVCTTACLTEACPAGFACTGDGLERYCTRAGDGCGGCDASGGAPGVLIVVLALARGRRTSRRASPRDSRA